MIHPTPYFAGDHQQLCIGNRDTLSQCWTWSGPGAMLTFLCGQGQGVS